MKIEQVTPERQKDLEDLYANEYRDLFLGHSYLQGPDFNRLLTELLASDRVKNIFNLR